MSQQKSFAPQYPGLAEAFAVTKQALEFYGTFGAGNNPNPITNAQFHALSESIDPSTPAKAATKAILIDQTGVRGNLYTEWELERTEDEVHTEAMKGFDEQVATMLATTAANLPQPTP